MIKEKRLKKMCIILAFSTIMSGFVARGLKKTVAEVNESICYEQEFELYNLASDKISNLFKELNLTNSTECFFLFNYLLYNGYLSVNNEYKYDDKGLLNIYGAYGYDVLTGKACCRSTSELFNEVLKKCGYNSYFITCKSSDTNSFELGANHAINIVEDDGKVNYFDTTCQKVFDVYDNKIGSITTYNNLYRFYIKPAYTLMFNYPLEDIINSSKLFFNDSEYLTEQYIKTEQLITYEMIIQNKDILLKFKDDFKENITDKVKKIS